MDASATAAAYDQLAERWLDGRFSRSDGVAQHQRALAFLAPAPEGAGGWALNVGCGCNTRFHALLRGQGLAIEGVDVSARMVALARAADPLATVHHADVCQWKAPRRYRVVSAWDSIWHVPLAQQPPLLMRLMRLLEPGGVFIASAGGLDAPGEHTDATMGPTVYYATPGIPALLQAVQQAGCVLRHFEFDQWPQPHLVLVARRPA